jgi:hypothetical protein
VGYPSRGSRKGKAGPLEAGRGKYSPPANPERVTSEALKRRDNGVLQKLRKNVKCVVIGKTERGVLRKSKNEAIKIQDFCSVGEPNAKLYDI